jgi:NitT/TauT family transport system permease protein
MKKVLQVIAGFIVIYTVWQGLAFFIGKPIIIPTPADTIRVTFQYICCNAILISIGQSTEKVILVLFLSIVIGFPIGLLLGKSTWFYEIFRPFIMVIQAVPVISWLTLVIFTWGVGWKGPIFISTLSLLPMSILTTISGVHNLDHGLMEMAYFYRIPGDRILKQIYLGSLFPFIMAILDVNIGQAWKIILVTEYLCNGNGLGERIMMARMNLDTSGVWALTLIAVFLGIFTDLLSKQILKKVFIYGTLSQDNSPLKIL